MYNVRCAGVFLRLEGYLRVLLLLWEAACIVCGGREGISRMPGCTRRIAPGDARANGISAQTIVRIYPEHAVWHVSNPCPAIMLTLKMGNPVCGWIFASAGRVASGRGRT